MSYGQWMALKPRDKLEAVLITDKVCKVCGRAIPTRITGSGSKKKHTCSPECAYKRHRELARMNYHKRKAMLSPGEKEKVCEICGKVIPVEARSPYTCSQECREQRHRERVKRNSHEKKARLMADGKI